MSSILKALRKIEEESPDLTSLPSPLSHTTGVRRSAKAHIRRRRFWVKIGSAVCLVAMMTAAGVFFLHRQQLIFSRPLPEPQSTSKTDTREMATPLDKSSVFRAKIAVGSPQSAPVSPQTRQPAKKQPQTSVPKRNSQKSDAAAVELRPKTEPSVSGGETVKRKTAASPPIPAADTYDRIDTSDLKLQALAWFDDASKRMAVINDRIVREGESVDGYQITQIRQEDVVVNDGSKSWLLKFDLKQ